MQIKYSRSWFPNQRCEIEFNFLFLFLFKWAQFFILEINSYFLRGARIYLKIFGVHKNKNIGTAVLQKSSNCATRSRIVLVNVAVIIMFFFFHNLKIN